MASDLLCQTHMLIKYLGSTNSRGLALLESLRNFMDRIKLGSPFELPSFFARSQSDCLLQFARTEVHVFTQRRGAGGPVFSVWPVGGWAITRYFVANWISIILGSSIERVPNIA